MIHPLVLSWLITMTTVGPSALRSPIHSILVAAPINLGRDAGHLVVALVQCSTLLVQYHLLQLYYPPSPLLLGLQHMPPLLQDIVHTTQHQTLTTPPITMLPVQSQHAQAIPLP